MSRETALRERVREAPKKAVRRKKAWEAPANTDFLPHTRVLAFDQSLTHTGWVDFQVTSEGVLLVYRRGTINIAVATKGHVGTMDKADILKRALAKQSVGTYMHIIGEMTPVQGWRLESSLLAGYVLRDAYPDVRFVSRQSALALLLPPEKRAEKKHSREVLARFPMTEFHLLHGSGSSRWNEHQRDALMLGLTHLHQIAQEGRHDR